MRPVSSRLLSAAAFAACLLGLAGESSAQGPRGGVGPQGGGLASGSSMPGGSMSGGLASDGLRLTRGVAGQPRFRRGRACGYGGCGGIGYGGYGLPLYGYGYGSGFGDNGNDPYDPRLLRGHLPDDRNSAVPAVAGIPAPPVLPPAIYVIGDGAPRASRGRVVRSSRRLSENRSLEGRALDDAASPSGPRVVRVR